MDRKSEVEVLRKFVNTTVRLTHKMAKERMQKLAPPELVNKLENLLDMNRRVKTGPKIEELFNDYESGVIDFDKMCHDMSVLSMEGTMDGQLIAQSFLDEHKEEIMNFQINLSAEKTNEMIDELGLKVSEIKGMN